MVLTDRYWEMAVLGNNKQCPKPIALARSWYQRRSEAEPLLTHEDDRKIQDYLYQVWRNEAEEAHLALLCLRCWVSHQIVGACTQLAEQFGQNYGFTVNDLCGLVLDDDGRPTLIYEPLSMKILKTYDPQQSALSTWANRITKSHPEINKFCLEHGLYRISDWALLNDTQPSGLGNILPMLSQAELDRTIDLLTSYHRVYRRDRMIQRQQNKKRASRCQEPTPAQLTEMMPDMAPEVVLSQLSDLARQLRAHRIAVRRGMPFTSPLDDIVENQQYTHHVEDDSYEQDDFIQRYRSLFLACLDEAIESVAQSYVNAYQKRKPPQGSLFLSALRLFHCEGLSMKAIAKQLGLSSQVQVSRLLQLKRFRAEVCAYWFNQLKEEVKTEALQFIDPERLSAITEQLEEILAEETEAVMAEAAAEAQSSKKQQTKSTFARRLCRVISNLGIPPKVPKK